MSLDGSTFTQYLSKRNNSNSQNNKSYCTPRSNEVKIFIYKKKHFFFRVLMTKNIGIKVTFYKNV